MSDATSSLSLPLLLPPLRLVPRWLHNFSSAETFTLSGYQLFAVTQRVTDRAATLPYIIVFSGDKSDSIVVEKWIVSNGVADPQRVQEVAKSLLKETSRLTEIEQGFLPVTSLPSLSSALSIVQLPSGNYQAHCDKLYLNINLQRLGLGGRSGLSLAETSQAQQLQFRQAYHLPVPSVSSLVPQTAAFPDTVLELIRLVQNALSLFGLGVVHIQIGDDTIDSSVSQFVLSDGDGLLCDETLEALEIFRVDIAESRLRLPANEAVLPPSLLSGLLSLVISTRGKLITLGASDVPKDPFERRNKFIAACRAFQQSHNITPCSPFLSRSFLLSLSSQYFTAQTPSTSKVSRALSLVERKGSVVKKKLRGENSETSNLEKLVNELEMNRIGGTTIAQLYGMKVKVGGKKRVEWDRNTRNVESDGGAAMTDATLTTSDNDTSTSFRRSVLGGVRARAGKAGKKIGDFSGISDMSTPDLISTSRRVPPSVVISPDRESIFSRDQESISMSRAGSELSRFPSAEQSTSLLPGANIFLNPSAATSMVSVGLGMPPGLLRKLARRSASERVGMSEGYDGMETGGESEAESARRGDGRGRLKKRRRHSFNTLADADEPFQLLSRKRLVMEVQVRMTAWNLRQREIKLIELANALQVVATSYSSALSSLTLPLSTRSELLTSLTATAMSLSKRVEAYTSSNNLLYKLSTGSSRLLYSHSVLDDKLADVVEFRRMVGSKIGGTVGSDQEVGSLGRGVEKIKMRQRGMRRLVESLNLWAIWGGGLLESVRKHLGRTPT